MSDNNETKPMTIQEAINALKYYSKIIGIKYMSSEIKLCTYYDDTIEVKHIDPDGCTSYLIKRSDCENDDGKEKEDEDDYIDYFLEEGDYPTPSPEAKIMGKFWKSIYGSEKEVK